MEVNNAKSDHHVKGNMIDHILRLGPGVLETFLGNSNKDFCAAMKREDLGDMVMLSLATWTISNAIPPLVKQVKCKAKSTTYRNNGNEAYRGGRPQTALEFYNQALMFAPKGSDELVLAYSNRSALLLQCKQFSACLKDIETCRTLGCPSNIADKLDRRNQEASNSLWMEKMTKNMRYNQFLQEFFKLDERRNPQIPCASADVGVLIKSEGPSIVAARDIKVGKLLAVETAFASILDTQLTYNSCHYCHTMSLNLIPCEGCCCVLFCDKKCLTACSYDYHRTECPIMDIHDSTFLLGASKLELRAAIKLKNQFASWTELIEASAKVGRERTRVSEINEIFDGNNKYSMLNFRDDPVFLYGAMYNKSFKCAVLLHYLENLTSFFPRHREERAAAMRAFGKLLMYLSLHREGLTMIPFTLTVLAKHRTAFCDVMNRGLFSFMGKLKRACNPNVLFLGLNNKVAMVAVRPIEAGEEITSGFLGHWLDNNKPASWKKQAMFIHYKIACDCVICSGEWEDIERNAKPTEMQLKMIKILRVAEANRDFNSFKLLENYQKSCKALEIMSNLPFSKEYSEAFDLFRKCLLDIQDNYSSNYILDCEAETGSPNVTNIK